MECAFDAKLLAKVGVEVAKVTSRGLVLKAG